MPTLFQTFLYETFRKSVILGDLEGAGTILGLKCT